MIRGCTAADFSAILAIVNEAAEKYRGAIPADCWHEPYMTESELRAEIADGSTSGDGMKRALYSVSWESRASATSP